MTVYLVQMQGLPFMKVGYTEDLPQRLLALQQHLPIGLQMIASMPGTVQDESYVHRQLRPWMMRGEWYALDAELALVLSRIFSTTVTPLQDEVGNVVLQRAFLKAEESRIDRLRESLFDLRQEMIRDLRRRLATLEQDQISDGPIRVKKSKAKLTQEQWLAQRREIAAKARESRWPGKKVTPCPETASKKKARRGA